MAKKKIYVVTNKVTTISECYVEAASAREAEEIVQMDHVSHQKEEVVDSTYRATQKIGKPKGRILYTKEGFFQGSGEFVRCEVEPQEQH